MKRAPIVVTGTVAGLALVLTFHTTPGSLTLPAGATSAAAPGRPPTGSGSTPGSTAGGTPAASASQSQQPAGTRTAVGPVVNYDYGLLSVRVTVSGKKITKVGIASINDGSNPRSQYIDQQAIPLLEQEVLQAQSANIQGVSGASYTSAGFAQSLQAALRSLGVA